jgi:hypothetical protein
VNSTVACLPSYAPPAMATPQHMLCACDCRLRLACTCTSLRQASLAWFHEVTVEVVPGYTDAASLAAWLQRHQGEQLLWAVCATGLEHCSTARNVFEAITLHPSVQLVCTSC